MRFPSQGAVKISESWSATPTSPVLDALALIAAALINHAPAGTLTAKQNQKATTTEESTPRGKV